MPSPSAQPPLPLDPVIPEDFVAPQVPQPACGLLAAAESSSPAPLSFPPAPIPPFTATNPAPPQQHCARAFFRGVDGIQASAAVQLQAAACGLLARRRLQKMRLEMHEAALTAIDLGKWGRDLAPSDGHQCSRQLATIFKLAQGSELQFYSSDRGGAFLLVIGGGTLPSAITFRHRPPRGRLRWSLLRLVSRGHTCPPLSFRWSP